MPSIDAAAASFKMPHDRLGAQFSARYPGRNSLTQKYTSLYNVSMNEASPARKLRWHDHSPRYPSLPPRIDSPYRHIAHVDFHWVPQTGKPSVRNAIKDATMTITQASRNQLINKVLDLVTAQIRQRYKADLTVTGLPGIVRPPPADPLKNLLHIKFDHSPQNDTVDLKVEIT